MNYIKKRFFRTKHQTTSLEGIMRPQNSDNLQRNRVFARFVGGDYSRFLCLGKNGKP